MKQLYLVLKTVVIASSTAWAANGAPQGSVKAAGWEPSVRSSHWGNLNQDERVDLQDLIALGQDFDRAKENFGRTGSEVLSDLGAHWTPRTGEEVPMYLRELDTDTRRMILDGSGSTKDEKGNVSGPVGLGYGITIGNDNSLKLGRQIYNAPVDKVVPLATLLPGMAITNEEYTADYMASYQQELEMKSLDVNAEIKYSLYSGSLSAKFLENHYRDATRHKFIGKSRIDFRWFIFPDKDIPSAMIDGVSEELNDPFAAAGVAEKYGTHYAYAQHKFAEIYAEVEMKTRTRRDFFSFESTVAAAFSGAATSAQFAASIKTLREKVESGMEVTVQLSRRGGPQSFSLPDGTTISLPVAFGIDDQLLEKIPEIIGAWRDGVASDGSNAATDQWYMRPITDFLPTTASLPFSRSTNLRAWFDRYVAFMENFQLMEDLIVAVTLPGQPTKYGYNPPFLYLKSTPLPAELPQGVWDSFIDYHAFVYNHYKTNLPLLLEAGRDLFTGKTDTFDANREEFRLWRPNIKPLTIIGRMDKCGAHVTNLDWEPSFCVPWVDLTDPAGNYTADMQGDCYCANSQISHAPIQYFPDAPTTPPYDPEFGCNLPGNFSWLRFNCGLDSGGTRNCPGYQAEYSWYDIGLVIRSGGEVIGYDCGDNPNCAGVEFDGVGVCSP